METITDLEKQILENENIKQYLNMIEDPKEKEKVVLSLKELAANFNQLFSSLGSHLKK